jgi:hypothetical protein
MTTNGLGAFKVTEGANGKKTYSNFRARVVREVEYVGPDLVRREMKLVFVASGSRNPAYEPKETQGGRTFPAYVRIPLELVSSNDFACRNSSPRREATLTLTEGSSVGQVDSLDLEVNRCPDQTWTFYDSSHEKPPKRPRVTVAIDAETTVPTGVGTLP